MLYGVISTPITIYEIRQAHITRPVEPFFLPLIKVITLASVHLCLANGTHSTIYLTLIHRTLLLDALITIEPYIGSDHLPIFITLNVEPLASGERAPLRKFNKSRWSDWNKTVSALLYTSNVVADLNPTT